MPPLGLRLLQGSEEIRSKSSTIEKDLAVICRNVPNVNQLAVFERAVQQVEKALGKSRDAEMGNLEAILKMVKEEVVKKRGNYQECRIVLEKGSELLRSLLASKRRYREKIKKLYEEEKKAIEEDHIYETDQKEHPILWTHLQIQTMEQSEQQQSTCIDVDGMFGTYGDVAWHLQTQGMVHLPELWIRCEGDGFQRITDSGYWWDRVRGTDSIKVPLIYAMSRNHVGDYHVILVHEGNKEFPMVLSESRVLNDKWQY
ncbi:hypothetical protein FRC17_000253 [Serendipita sp. 399]|nr:hypothetical protein FRC17_000253 [Serendipita sp. 399]